MPGRFALQPTLSKIWHAPDNFRLMDPLPPLHRRGIIAGFLLVIIGFLLPSGDDAPAQPVIRNAQLDIQSQTQSQQGNLQQPLPPLASTPPVNDPGQAAPVMPEVVQEDQPDDEPQQVQSQPQTQAQPAPAETQQQSVSGQSVPGIEQQWRSYRVEPGKTLAQLFRDHNLPPTDVYAMSKVEGAGKPLSSLQAGQIVQVRQNANGVVTGLTIDSGNGQQVLFTRQGDGSYIRVR
ncbi:LysM-like peptidoglycan-binding domain-containing protein [Scandinavium sp. M-37]|uniref:LysM-like peptidoglycan-binding domain-containing protein n=1 Tax=Scandinavium sp. M-37 TaxID=3373077 RepID=UPI003745398E